MSDAVVVYTTVPNRDVATQISHVLLTERLIACSNIMSGVQSWFRWDNAIQTDEELVVILKTTAEKLGLVTKRIRELHTYKVPCIVALPIVGGNKDYIDWIQKETE